MSAFEQRREVPNRAFQYLVVSHPILQTRLLIERIDRGGTV